MPDYSLNISGIYREGEEPEILSPSIPVPQLPPSLTNNLSQDPSDYLYYSNLSKVINDYTNKKSYENPETWEKQYYNELGQTMLGVHPSEPGSFIPNSFSPEIYQDIKPTDNVTNTGDGGLTDTQNYDNLLESLLSSIGTEPLTSGSIQAPYPEPIDIKTEFNPIELIALKAKSERLWSYRKLWPHAFDQIIELYSYYYDQMFNRMSKSNERITTNYGYDSKSFQRPQRKNALRKQWTRR